jgi:hypothetical protein
LKRYSRNLVFIFLVTALLVMAVVYWLDSEGRFPLHDEPVALSYIIAVGLYNGLAVAGLMVLARYHTGGGVFLTRLSYLVAIFMVAAVLQILIVDPSPDPVALVVSVLWETARAVCVAFAVAYLAHALMVRYLPSTILRIRDVTPVLDQGRDPVTRHRFKHIKRTRWVFELTTRPYLDTTKLRLRTLKGPSFDWRSWGEATFWTCVGLIALSVYVEAYPRVEERFDLVFTSMISAHLLAIVPILVLPMFPIRSLGPEIPTGDGVFQLDNGFRQNLTRWIKIAFFPIIAVGLLFRTMSQANAEELVQTLLITLPTAAITCMVYLECFRSRTVAEVHRAVPRVEQAEREVFGDDEPWRGTSLMDGVDVVEGDVWIGD